MAEAPKPNTTNLPAFLEMTPAQIAVSNRIQEEVRQALHGRVQANQEEARLIRGIHAERAARATLDVLAKEKRRKGRSEAVKLHLAKLADAYAEQGRYTEAAKLHPVKARAKEYSAIEAAISRRDTDSCKCVGDEVTDPVSGKTLHIPNVNHVIDVYSIKHKRMMPLIRCEKCGHLNVRPLPEVLAQRQRAMGTAQEKSVTDADVLRPAS